MDNTIIEDLAVEILRPLPHNSILLVHGRQIAYTTQYAKLCLNRSASAHVIILNQELMLHPWYSDILRAHAPQVMFPGFFHFPWSVFTSSILSYVSLNAGKFWGTGHHADSYSIENFFASNYPFFKIFMYSEVNHGLCCFACQHL